MAKPSLSDLCEAAKAGDLSALKRAISAGAELNAGELSNGSKQVPLVLAAMGNHVDCVEELLAAGAAVDATGGDRITATMIAAAHEHRECLAVLIKAGADVNARAWDGMTPAMWVARFSGMEDSPCLRILIDAGADLRPADSLRRTAATHAKIGCKPMMSAFIKSHVAAFAESKKLAKVLARSGECSAVRSPRM